LEILDIRVGGGAGRGLVLAWVEISLPASESSYDNLRYRQIANYPPLSNTIGVNNWNAWASFYGDGSSFVNRFFIARYQMISTLTGQAGDPQFAVGEILAV
jgi:hypothetical protein